ncbi:von willebrand factor a domain-containing protein 5a [Anaeramoeba flamelloides]|uniref:von willebrand factor a domain-containing protein 5a n=1 Tax=Anaeramoeba flamelloides TaxID=1746091 RepID=A0AAV7ZAK0_9EUKA|nr:von willebrand factor a domain-containing protein 5a [Anaeramoeba flamelloides]
MKKPTLFILLSIFFLVSNCRLLNAETKEEISLKEISVHSEIYDFTAEVTIEQIYFNDQDTSIETIFNFPLDSKSSVNSFIVEIGEEVLEAIIHEKKHAEEVYQSSIRSGRSAALLTTIEPDVFQIKIGRLLAKERCVIKLTYVTELTNVDQQTVEFLLPQTLVPRYVSPRVPILNNLKELFDTKIQDKVPYEIKLEFNIQTNKEIVSVRSRSHPYIKSNKIDEFHHEISFQPKEAQDLGKDISLQIQVKELHKPSLLLQQDSESDKVYGMLRFFPDLTDFETNTEIIFVLDRSGSMRGTRTRAVSKAMTSVLKELNSNIKFNIVGFGSNYQFLFDAGSVDANEKNLETALKYCKSLEADFGGTEILSPLEAIFKKPLIPGYSRQIFLLTDGEVYNVQHIIDRVRRQRASTRIFTFGIGHGASRALVEGIAQAGEGASEIILDENSIQKIMEKQFQRALTPSITDTSIQLSENGAKYEWIAPFRAPPIFKGKSVTYYAAWDQIPEKGSISLNGYSLQSKYTDEILFSEAIRLNKGRVIGSLAAKTMINEFEQKMSMFHQPDGSLNEGVTDSFIKTQIIGLSKLFNVISSETTFLAVSKIQKENPNAPLTQEHIPVQHANEIEMEMDADMKIGSGMADTNSYQFNQQAPKAVYHKMRGSPSNTKKQSIYRKVGNQKLQKESVMNFGSQLSEVDSDDMAESSSYHNITPFLLILLLCILHWFWF